MLKRLFTLIVLVVVAASVAIPLSASAATSIPITGTGSTWTQNALDQWRKNVAVKLGMTVNYSGVGSSAGRRDYVSGSVDFAVSELAFQGHPQDVSAPEVPPRGYTYVPATAGGSAFMYNLKIDGKRVTDLRLSGSTIAGIFTGAITNWNDPAIARDNPRLRMPAQSITPVVRSDGSGSTYFFTQWLAEQYGSVWRSFCNCDGPTSQFPMFGNSKAQNGSLGVAGYVSQDYGTGAITYVENSYIQKSGFPAAKVLNAAGYYVAPTADAVSIALLGATVDAGQERNLSGVFANQDPRAYPVSSYSYFIVPTEVGGVFTAEKGAALGAFLRYALCEGQQQAAGLGYAPLPLSLVTAGSSQLARIPGAGNWGVDINDCNNPTFAPGDSVVHNTLLSQAAYPSEGDRTGGGSPFPPDGLPLVVGVIDAHDGALSLSAPSGNNAVFGAPALQGGRSATRGKLAPVVVSDARGVSAPGWTLVMQLTDFVKLGDASTRFSGAHAGIVPTLVPNDNGASVARGTAPDIAVYPAEFAAAAPGKGIGDTTLGGDVLVLAPADKPAGTYVSTLTLTLTSR